MPLPGILHKLKTVVPVGSPLWYVCSLLKRSMQALHPSSKFHKIRWHVVHQNILLEDYKSIYFPIPKVACSSLKGICADLLKMDVPAKEIEEEIHLLPFPCAKKYKIRKQYADYFKFAFVRNPWSRLVSCYNDKINYAKGHVYERYENSFVNYLKSMNVYSENMSFDKFVNIVSDIQDDYAEAHFRSQYLFLMDDKGHFLPNFVGRLEQLDKDFTIITQQIGITKKIPHIRSGKPKSFKDYYTDKTARIVKKRYEKDIELFGYRY